MTPQTRSGTIPFSSSVFSNTSKEVSGQRKPSGYGTWTKSGCSPPSQFFSYRAQKLARQLGLELYEAINIRFQISIKQGDNSADCTEIAPASFSFSGRKEPVPMIAALPR